MSQDQLMKLALAGAIVYGVYKFGPNAFVKGMAVGMAGAIVGKQIPYVKDVI